MATQADLDAINKAINSGAIKVKYQDREVNYASTDVLYRIKANLEKELGVTNDTSGGKIQVVFNSGL